uniref:Uncharacterized protein n=1 Tax=Cacopsylla melanoneura TaxID=428564 RepID=A0A8D8LI60_9HEMI
MGFTLGETIVSRAKALIQEIMMIGTLIGLTQEAMLMQIVNRLTLGSAVKFQRTQNQRKIRRQQAPTIAVALAMLVTSLATAIVVVRSIEIEECTQPSRTIG